VVGREAAERLEELGIGLGRIRRRFSRKCIAADLGAKLPPPRPVDRAVDDDPVQPGREGAAAIEAVQRPHRGEKGLLGDVFRRCRVVDDEVGRPVGPRPVVAEELLERGGRAALRAADPGALVRTRGVRPPRVVHARDRLSDREIPPSP